MPSKSIVYVFAPLNSPAPVYALPRELSWASFARALERAEEGLAQLDERLKGNALAEGWIERSHFSEACAALYLEGELVHLENLVLRDARMNVPTALPWHHPRDVGAAGLAPGSAARGALACLLVGHPPAEGRAPGTGRVGPEAAGARLRVGGDKENRLEEWREVVAQTGEPALVAAAVAYDAWCRITPFQRASRLGAVLVSGLLKGRGKTRHHRLALSTGMRACAYRRAHFHDLGQRVCGFLEGVATAAELGHKDLDRLSLAQDRLTLRLKGRRSTSRLPDLVSVILSRPLISIPLAARELKVSPQAVEGMLK